jgi:predicted regulator of Ras-like GTPase activity (Roadblock/LC7/MglB family)
MPEETMLSVLEDLLREEDVLAVMLARKNEISIMPSPEKFKLKNPAVFNLLQSTMNEFFAVIEKFSEQGLDKVYFELGEYEVMFFLISGDTALVAITPALANRGFLEVEMENSRRAVKKLISLVR